MEIAQGGVSVMEAGFGQAEVGSNQILFVLVLADNKRFLLKVHTSNNEVVMVANCMIVLQMKKKKK